MRDALYLWDGRSHSSADRDRSVTELSAHLVSSIANGLSQVPKGLGRNRLQQGSKT
jgi:hypothetical protein